MIAIAWLVVALAAPRARAARPAGPGPAAPGGPRRRALVRHRRSWAATCSPGSCTARGCRSRSTLLLVALSVLIGGLLGACAGYFGRWVDETIMRIADLVFAFPTVILAMVVAAALGASLINAVLAVLVVSWPAYARVTRGLVLGLRAARVRAQRAAAGLLARWRSLRADVLPERGGPGRWCWPPSTSAPRMLLLSGLSFLGLGAKPPTAGVGRDGGLRRCRTSTRGGSASSRAWRS